MSKLLRNMLIGFQLRAGDGDDGDEAVGTNNDARVALLNSIGDNADRGRAEELADVHDDGSTSQFEAPASKSGEESGEDAEAIAAREAEQIETDRLAAEAASKKQEEAPSGEKILRKVNGVEMEITEDLLTRAQKIAAADNFLAEAKRIRDEAAQQRQANVEVSKETVEDDLAETARAIQMGTEEEAVAALRKLQQSGPSLDDFSKKIDERLTFHTAFKTFKTDYSDIYEDPILRKLAEDTDIALLQQGDTRSYEERYAAIGNHLRNWVKSKAPAPETKTEVKVDNQSSKEKRKEEVTPPPKAAQGKHIPKVEVETEESAQDIIANMAKQRGGPQWMQGQPQ